MEILVRGSAGALMSNMNGSSLSICGIPCAPVGALHLLPSGGSECRAYPRPALANYTSVPEHRQRTSRPIPCAAGALFSVSYNDYVVRLSRSDRFTGSGIHCGSQVVEVVGELVGVDVHRGDRRLGAEQLLHRHHGRSRGQGQRSGGMPQEVRGDAGQLGRQCAALSRRRANQSRGVQLPSWYGNASSSGERPSMCCGKHVHDERGQGHGTSSGGSWCPLHHAQLGHGCHRPRHLQPSAGDVTSPTRSAASSP